jgi:hypothetical protein
VEYDDKNSVMLFLEHRSYLIRFTCLSAFSIMRRISTGTCRSLAAIKRRLIRRLAFYRVSWLGVHGEKSIS